MIARIGSRSVLAAVIAVLVFAAAAAAQKEDLPKKLYGYRMHREPVRLVADLSTIRPEGSPPAAAASSSSSVDGIEMIPPRLVKVSPLGVTLAVKIAAAAPPYSGKIDRLVFRKFTVNGLSVEVADLEPKVQVRAGERFVMPEPAEIFIPTHSLVRGAWRETVDSKPQWHISGRVFVLGTFRRYGMNFKRSVPVDLDLIIDNPLPEFAVGR